MNQERKLFPKKNGEIKYSSVEGGLQYSYEECFESSAESGAKFVNRYSAQGLIPSEIIALGDDAIKGFVKAAVDEKVNSDKERRSQRDEYRSQLRHPLEIDYQDVLIRGQLRSADGTRLSADLLEPYQGTAHVNFNMFSAMSGHYIYRGDPSYFSEYAIERGKGLLVSAYHIAKAKAENPEITGLTDILRE